MEWVSSTLFALRCGIPNHCICVSGTSATCICSSVGSNDWIGELPKVPFYEYLVLKPAPLITELLGTAVLREDKVEKHNFSADGETGPRVPRPCVFLYLPEGGNCMVSPGRVRSGGSVWGYPPPQPHC